MAFETLFINLSLIITLSFLYSITIRNIKLRKKIKQVIIGVSFGAITVLIMLNSFDFGHGVIFDARSVLLSLAAIFGGPLAAIIAGLLAIFYRLMVGGAGAIVGIIVIAFTSLFGIILAKLKDNNKIKLNYIHIYIYGLVIHLIVIALFLALPKALVPLILSEIWLPFIGVFPIATVLVYFIMQSQEQHISTEIELSNQKRLLEVTEQIAQTGGWKYNPKMQTWELTNVAAEIISSPTNKAQHNFIIHLFIDKEEFEALLNKACSAFEAFDVELQLSDNMEQASKWVRILGKPIIKSGVTFVKGSIQDITKQKATEDLLFRNEELLRRAFEHIPDVMVIYDKDLRIKNINSATTAITGLQIEDFIGKKDEELWSPEVYEPYLPALKLALRSNLPQTVECKITLPNTQTKYLNISCIPLKDMNGEVNEVLGITVDLTERKAAERSMLEMEKRFRETLENIQLIAVLLDVNGDITFCNKFFLSLVNREHDNVIGKNWFDTFIPKEQPMVKEVFKESIETGVIADHYENEILAKNNSIRLIRFSNTLLKDSTGKIIGTTSIGEDITDFRAMIQSLKESEEKYRQLVEMMPDGIAIHKNGTIIYANAAAKNILKIPEDQEIIGLSISKVIHPDNLQTSVTRINAMLEGNDGLYPAEDRYIRFDGKTIDVEVTAESILYENEKSVQVIVRDITEKKQTEKRIFNSLIQGADSERNRISKEIHDGLGQNLTAANLNLNSIYKTINTLSENDQSHFNTGLAFLKNAIEESRSIAHNLMPRAIIDFGLIISLKSLVDQIRITSEFDISFYENLNNQRFNTNLELNLYRIAQECINNIVKHSKAKQVNIQLVLHSNILTLMIEDNGIGFNYGEFNEEIGLGLNNIRNRVLSIDGILNIDSKLMSGTTITVELKISNE